MSMRQIFKTLGGPGSAAVGALVGGVSLGAVNAGVGAASGALGTKILQAAGHVGYDTAKSVIDNVVGSSIIGGAVGAVAGCVGGLIGGIEGTGAAVAGGSGLGLFVAIPLQTVESMVGYQVLQAAMSTAANATTEAVMTLGQEAAATATGATVFYGSLGLAACYCACMLGCGVLGALAKEEPKTTNVRQPRLFDLTGVNAHVQSSDVSEDNRELPSLGFRR